MERVFGNNVMCFQFKYRLNGASVIPRVSEVNAALLLVAETNFLALFCSSQLPNDETNFTFYLI